MITRCYPYLLFVLVLALGANTSFAQQEEKESVKTAIIQQRIELISEQSEDGDIDFLDLLERLTFFYDHPLNLNTASRKDLEDLEMLTPFQIASIMSYREEVGKMVSIYEIAYIDGIGANTVEAIMPFISVTSEMQIEKFSLKTLRKRARNDVFIRYSRILEEQQGYKEISEEELLARPSARYLGSPDRVYMRWRMQAGNLFSAGITGDKDAGEEFGKGSNPNGFDFYSAHLFARNVGIFKQIAIGDFQAKFGQGLTFWSGFAFGKTPEAMNVKRLDRKLQPYAAANENLFLRGGGVTMAFKKIELTTFASDKNLDANIVAANDTLDFEERQFTSIQISGFHRTPREVENRRVLREQIAGSHLAYEGERLKVGLTSVYRRLGGTSARNLNFYNQFDLNDNENLNTGIDFNLILKHINVFGEASISRNGGKAGIVGAYIELDPRVELVIAQRNYGRDYQAYYSAAFGENTRSQNERGTYIGARVKLTSKLNLNAYFDRYQFDWLRFRTDAPSHGADWLAQLNYALQRNVNFYVRYREEHQERNQSDLGNVNKQVPQVRRYVRFNADYRLAPGVNLASRVEWSHYKLGNNAAADGIMLFQDVKYTLPSDKVAFYGRLALFDIPDYNARIYAYENDVLYFFSVPAYFNRGVRYYAMARIKLNRQISFWIRYSRTHYANVESIGSGLEMIEAPHRSEIRLQLRLRF